MEKKTIVICGITGGIGQEIAKQMLTEKNNVCGVYNNQDKIERLEEKLGTTGLSLFKIDLMDAESTAVGFEKLISKHPRIDVVVFSVSLPIEYKPILDSVWRDYARHLDLQLKGIYNIVQNLVKQIKSGQGIKFIILLTDACIGKPPAGMSHYVSAKYALLGMAKTMAVEFAKYNCTVNLVSPGMVQTDLISVFPAKLIEIQSENNPLKRIASPIDVANVVLFLSQDESNYLNGVNITVNGGQVIL